MSALEELERAWGQFVEQVNEYEGLGSRALILRREDGSEQALILDPDAEWRYIDRSALDIEFQVGLLREPERIVSLLRGAMLDSRQRETRPLLFPEAVDAIRTRLADAALKAPEVVLWEIYGPILPVERTGA